MRSIAAGRIKVMAGTGSNSTAEALRLTRWAAKEGADASLQVAPYYNKPTQEGFYQHFKAVAEDVGLPIDRPFFPSFNARWVDDAISRINLISKRPARQARQRMLREPSNRRFRFQARQTT